MSAEKDLKININRKIKDIAFYPNISWTMSDDQLVYVNKIFN